MTLVAVNSLLKYGPEIKEILLVSNNSSAAELDVIKDGIAEVESARVLEYNHPFNYQKINNWAVTKTTGNFIMFLNNDTELVPNSKGLLEAMTQKAAHPEVGI